MRKYLIPFVVVVLLTILSQVESKDKQAKESKNSASLNLLALKKHLTQTDTNMHVSMPALQEIVNYNLTKVFITRKKLQKQDKKMKEQKKNKGEAKDIKKLDHKIVDREKSFDKCKNRIAVFRALKKVMFKIKTDSLEAQPQIKKLELIKEKDEKKLDKKLDEGLKKMFGDSDKMKLHTSRRLAMKKRLAIKKLDDTVEKSRALIGRMQVGDMVFKKMKFMVLLFNKIVKRIESFTQSKRYYLSSSKKANRDKEPVKGLSLHKKADEYQKKISHLNLALDHIEKKAKRLAETGGKRVHIKVTTKANICYFSCPRKPTITNAKTKKDKKPEDIPKPKKGPVVDVKKQNEKYKTDIPENRRIKNKKTGTASKKKKTSTASKKKKTKPNHEKKSKEVGLRELDELSAMIGPKKRRVKAKKVHKRILKAKKLAPMKKSARARSLKKRHLNKVSTKKTTTTKAHNKKPHTKKAPKKNHKKETTNSVNDGDAGDRKLKSMYDNIFNTQRKLQRLLHNTRN